MSGAVEVAKKKGPKGSKEESLTATLKVSPTFKARLEEVARYEDTEPGRLIERHMGQWLNQEFVRVSRKKAEDLIKGAAEVEKDLG